MFQREIIAAGPGEPYRFPGEQNPVFEDVVHARTCPFVLVGKGQIELLCCGGGIAGTFTADLHPQVIV